MYYGPELWVGLGVFVGLDSCVGLGVFVGCGVLGGSGVAVGGTGVSPGAGVVVGAMPDGVELATGVALQATDGSAVPLKDGVSVGSCSLASIMA